MHSLVPPSIPPWQLVIRFALEMGSLFAVGTFARAAVGPTALGWAAAVAVPTALAIVWGTFAVPGDPSRSGNAPVRVPGWLRLVIELAVFGAGAASLAASAHWRSLAVLAA